MYRNWLGPGLRSFSSFTGQRLGRISLQLWFVCLTAHRTSRDPTGLFHCSHYSATANSNTSQICRSSRRTTNMRRSIPLLAILVAEPFLILYILWIKLDTPGLCDVYIE